MVTTRADRVKNKSKEIVTSAKEYDHPPSYYHDVDNHSLPFEEVKGRNLQQALQKCNDRNGPLAKAFIDMITNPPPWFESDDDGRDEVHNGGDKVVDPVPRKNETEYTPPNTDQTFPVPTAVKAII